jgi:undecaprenyl-diphosphatase
VIVRHRSSLRGAIAWLGGLDLILLLAVLAMVAGAWSFIAIADKVVEGRTRRTDEWLIRSLRNPADPSDPIGPEWLEEVGRDLTALGGVAVLSLVTVTVVGFLLIRRGYHSVCFLLIATVGGLVLSLLLKSHFARPRPELVPHLSAVYTSSFPSGHSMLSAVVYLTLGALLARFVEGPALKLYILLVAMVLTLLVGISRVYMGVHYPSDVLAGWSVGLSWAILCWLSARHLQRGGIVEGPAK